MFRTHHCGVLRLKDVGTKVTLAGWVQKSRDLGGLTFVDLRDRYGITQLAFNMEKNESLCLAARELGREWVIQAEGTVKERESKNKGIATGEIEIEVSKLTVLNAAKTPPFTIEEDTDGGDELRMKYRYLDLRRPNVRENIILRHKMAQSVRAYLNGKEFLEVETPVLIKSTPEGARDFIVPSRLSEGQFYALPQSPQTFKQLLMVSGFDKYYQIVRCFRDEDLRADRQPEFTQIDCEMTFVERADILETFEGLVKSIFKEIKGIDITEFPHMSYDQAMNEYGVDKPDIRFEMRIKDITTLARNKGFNVFDQAEYIGGIAIPNGAAQSRKQIDQWTDFVKTPQIGGKGLVWIRIEEDGSAKSSVDKFFSQEQLLSWAKEMGANPGDLILLSSDIKKKALTILGQLRLRVAKDLDMIPKGTFAPLWVIDFPLLEWDDDANRFFAMHHPFTSWLPEDEHLLDTNPDKIRANAYDMVINGVEVGGGSIRIFSREKQQKMFDLLHFTREEAQEQFGFLMGAFEFGAPPHGGIAFGFDRLCALFGGSDSIRDYIAFPKNNAGRDVMIDAPSHIDAKQLHELGLK